jgi:hypothetical protein
MTNTEGLVERHPLKEKRRANKPLLERKRRARINDGLRDLKSLVLSSLNKDVSSLEGPAGHDSHKQCAGDQRQ